MKQSESIKAIAPVLLTCQTLFGAAVKKSVNPHLNSRYADLAAVMDAVKKILNDNGILFVQTACSSADGVGVETTLIHVSTCEFIGEVLILPLSKKDPQAAGSAITYARRYGLQSICGLLSEDDDGHSATAEMSDEEIQRWCSSIEAAKTRDAAIKIYKNAMAAATKLKDKEAGYRIKEAASVLKDKFPEAQRND